MSKQVAKLENALQPLTPENVMVEYMLQREAKTGRPTSYTPEIAASFVADLEKGLTITEICDKPENPSRWAVFRWEESIPEFRNALIRVRKYRAQRIADRHLSIVDLAVAAGTDPKSKPDAYRVASQSLQWQAACLDRETYGDQKRLDVTIKDDLGEALLKARLRLKTYDAEDAEVIP